MSVPSEILTMMECCINNDGHYVKEAVLLSCGANACKKCICELNRNDFKCYKCEKIHRIDDPAKQFHNPAIDILVEKVYLKKLIQMIKLGFTDAFKKVEGMKKCQL
jgi:hypothetical protein